MIKNFINKKVILVVFLIIVSVLIFIFIDAKRANNKKDGGFAAEIAESARHGWRWLRVYDGDPMNPSAGMIIKIINDKYCYSAEAENFWKKQWENFKDHYYLSVFERLFVEIWQNYKISAKIIKILNTPQTYYDIYFPQAIYCDLYPVEKDFEVKTFENIKKEKGYDLTHKFWSAILFRDNGCSLTGYNLDKIIFAGAEKIAEEQKKNKGVDDLYVERTAFLLYFGFKEKVKEDWIKNIILAQKESGAWETPSLGENPHTTALAIWALAEYSQKCPF